MDDELQKGVVGVQGPSLKIWDPPNFETDKARNFKFGT